MGVGKYKVQSTLAPDRNQSPCWRVYALYSWGRLQLPRHVPQHFSLR